MRAMLPEGLRESAADRGVRRVVAAEVERREGQPRDRRSHPRGGRREGDRPGRYPVLLLADSHAGSRRESARYLSQCGFHVLEVTNAREAQEAVRATPPHVILTELTLPGMPAWRVPRLGHGAPAADIPVIVLNPVIIALNDFEGAPAGPMRSRPAGLLVKPLVLPAMLQEVRRVLRIQLEPSAGIAAAS
jgi:CheY-like chemotaxis protein